MSVAEKTKTLLTGGLTGPQQAAQKAKQKTDDDIIAMHDADTQTVRETAAQFHPGTPVDKGSTLINDLRVADKAKAFQTKATARRFTQAEIDQEARLPNAQGEVAIAAVLRLQRKCK